MFVISNVSLLPKMCVFHQQWLTVSCNCIVCIYKYILINVKCLFGNKLLSYLCCLVLDNLCEILVTIALSVCLMIGWFCETSVTIALFFCLVIDWLCETSVTIAPSFYWVIMWQFYNNCFVFLFGDWLIIWNFSRNCIVLC